MGFEVVQISDKELQFEHWPGDIIRFWPYKGWASGKTIEDGRGLKNLLKQL